MIGTARPPTTPEIRVRSLVDRTPVSHPIGGRIRLLGRLIALQSRRPMAYMSNLVSIERVWGDFWRVGCEWLWQNTEMLLHKVVTRGCISLE